MMPSTTAAPSGQLERVRGLLGELLARDAWPRERLLAYQRARLRALLEHAVTSAPYYRRTLGPDAPDAPLAELPTLSKAAVMEHFDQIVCDPRLRLEDLRAHMAAGPDAARPFLGEYRVASTSGSTGVRGVFAHTHREFAVWAAASLRAFTRAGAAPSARLAAIGAPSPLAITRQLFADLQATRPDAPRLSVATPLPELVEALNAYQPDGLVGYPTIAGLLAAEQLAGRLRIRPRFGAYGAEPLTPDVRRRIRDAWGFEPATVYAATEALLLGSSTPYDPCLELSEDLLVIEVVDEHDRPVPAGTPGAKVLVTNLVNYAQPLIRYQLSDVVTPADGPDLDGPNPAGRPWRRIAAIEGRCMDTLYLPGRRGGEVALHPSAFGPAFASLPDLRQYQLLHDHTGLRAKVVVAGGASPGLPARLCQSLVQAIEAAGAVPPTVSVEQVAALAREPGPAAKFKLVKYTIPSTRPIPAG
jgi:phenylacetate-coenzyme A ligase PaaK-like adenylate-forming protein